MKKLYIYIDETYQLHKAPQFYAFGGFLTNDIEKMRSEYKKLLRKCDAIKEEVKSNDKKSEKIREKIIKDGYLNENLKYFGISQKRDQNMNYEYFEDNIYKQEIVFYESLLKILLSEIRPRAHAHQLKEIYWDSKLTYLFFESFFIWYFFFPF